MSKPFNMSQFSLDLSTATNMVKVVVPVSGGKDSQASLKLARQEYPAENVRGLFCDTGFEHPMTYAHVKRMRTLYGIQIDTVQAGTVEQQCLKHKRFPGGGARFCTEELKIWPAKRYYKELAVEQGAGFEVWYGMRSDESGERKLRYAGKVCDELYAPHEVMDKYPKYLAKLGVMFRLAVLDWSTADVFEFLAGEQNPLYPAGFDRVGCFPCQAAGDAHKEKAYAFDEFGAQQKRKMIAISLVIDKPLFNSKGGQARFAAEQDGPGCSICTI